MSLITIPNTFSAGAVIVASQHNSNFSTISSDYNGNIDNTNIATNAAIAYSKLALTGGIVNGDINASAAIANSKLNLASVTQDTTLTGKVLIGSTHQGDVFYDNGTQITRLTPGTSGQFLQTQGAAANPQWGSTGLVFVSNTVVSSATSTGNITIDSTLNYLIRFTFTAFSGPDTISLIFNNDSGSHYSSTLIGVNSTAAGTTVVGGSTSTTGIILMKNQIISSTSAQVNGTINLFPQTNTTSTMYASGTSFYTNNTGITVAETITFNGFRQSQSDAVISFKILSTSATFSGNVYLYKYLTA